MNERVEKIQQHAMTASRNLATRQGRPFALHSRLVLPLPISPWPIVRFRWISRVSFKTSSNANCLREGRELSRFARFRAGGIGQSPITLDQLGLCLKLHTLTKWPGCVLSLSFSRM